MNFFRLKRRISRTMADQTTVKVNASGSTWNITADSSSLQNDDCDVYMDSMTVKFVKTAAYCILLLTSLGGNSLIVAAIFRKRELRTIINFLILNMCISDLLIPIFVLPKRIKQIYFPRKVWLLDGAFGALMCKMSLFVENTSVIVSVIGLLVIATERLYCVVYPLKRQPIRTIRTCLTCIAMSWIVGLGYCGHFLYTQRLVERNGTTFCEYSWKPVSDTRTIGNTLHLIFLICFTVIPFIVLSVIYLIIIVSLHRKRREFCLASIQRKHRMKQNRKISLMLAIVVVVFLLSWTPANVYIFLRNFADWETNHPCRYRYLIFTANFLSYSYIAINPIIYYIFSSKFKKCLQEIMCCYGCLNKRHSSSTKSITAPISVLTYRAKEAVVLSNIRALGSS